MFEQNRPLARRDLRSPEKREFIDSLLCSPLIDRLNVGPISTMTVFVGSAA